MIRSEVDTTKATRLIRAILSNGQRLPIRRMMVIGYRSVLRNFKEQGRPEKWAPLSEAYLESRPERRGGMILQDTGHHLRDTVKSAALGRFDFMVFTRSKIAPFHDHGDQMSGGKMPNRPFMVWQDEDIKSIEDILADHLIKGRAS